MDTLENLGEMQARLAADVQTQTNDIALIQTNLTQQLTDLHNEIQKLHDVTPPLDLTAITMSINQLESNHAALLALAKQAAGVDTIPAPDPIISSAPLPPDPAPAAPAPVFAPVE